MAEPPSSPPRSFASAEESASWYKRQYEQLCDELSEFRESSHELEAELEKDLDSADKRQRALEQKVESLKFEAEEWKEKCKKAKTESNSAQNALEKEITTLRDNNRGLLLKLRDIEVANDDIERQARNTTSSLEDLEFKYNVAIERTVMLEEEIKLGEQEREMLRIEAQRLREELSDIKIEADIMQDKIKKAEHRHLSSISTDMSIPDSDTCEDSPQSTASSPLISTPPNELSIPSTTKLRSQEPPSPPMSDASATLRGPSSKTIKAPASSQKDARIPSSQRSTTPKPTSLAPSGVRQPGTRSSVTATRTPAPPRTANRTTSRKAPPSASLTHVRSLTAQMQRLEARVQSARSKLPAPNLTPPRFSPRSSVSNVPGGISMRSRKPTVGSVGSSTADETPTQPTDTERSGKFISRLASGVPRLSYAQPPHRSNTHGTEGTTLSISRPSSRSSVSTYGKPDRPPSRTEVLRPRTSMSGMRIPIALRSRSSIGGSLHSHSQSQNCLDIDEMDERTPTRRVSRGVYGMNTNSTAIPTPGATHTPRRQTTGEHNNPFNRRVSISVANDTRRTKKLPEKLADLGETY